MCAVARWASVKKFARAVNASNAKPAAIAATAGETVAGVNRQAPSAEVQDEGDHHVLERDQVPVEAVPLDESDGNEAARLDLLAHDHATHNTKTIAGARIGWLNPPIRDWAQAAGS
jgi:hypothetical protein